MQTFETPGSVSLQIKLPSGRVVVTTVDEPRTTVEVVARGRRGQDAIDEIDITMHESAGRHELKIEQKDKFRWGPIQITWGGDFECRVTCPPGADLEFGGGSTDLRVEGELGEVCSQYGVWRYQAPVDARRSAGEDGQRRRLGRDGRGRGVVGDRLG